MLVVFCHLASSILLFRKHGFDKPFQLVHCELYSVYMPALFWVTFVILETYLTIWVFTQLKIRMCPNLDHVPLMGLKMIVYLVFFSVLFCHSVFTLSSGHYEIFYVFYFVYKHMTMLFWIMLFLTLNIPLIYYTLKVIP